MRTRMLAVAAVLVLGLTACSPTPEATPTVQASAPASTPSDVSSPTPAAETPASEAGPPQECIDYDPGELADDSAYSTAAATAELPAGIILNPGLQVIESTDDPGNVEVVARVCSDGIDRAELIEAGNAIARAIYAAPDHEAVTLLMISSYVPSGDYLDQQSDLDTIQTDYELYLWDAEGRSLDSNWN